MHFRSLFVVINARLDQWKRLKTYAELECSCASLLRFLVPYTFYMAQELCGVAWTERDDELACLELISDRDNQSMRF